MSRRNSNHKQMNRSVVMAAAAAAVWFGHQAYAVPVTWDADPGTALAQDGAGTWDLVSLNWLSGVGNAAWNNAGTDVAVFGGGGSGGVVLVGQSTAIAGLTFNADGYSLINDPDPLVDPPPVGTFTIAGATPINVTVGTATITTAITGAGSVTYNVAATSTLNFNVASTYTGGTTFAGGGTIDMSTPGTGALGPGSVTFNGAALRLGAAGLNRQINILAGTTNVFSLGGNGTFNSGSFVTTGSGTVTLEARTAGNTITIDGNNESFSGTFLSSGGGILRFRAVTADSANAVWDLGNNTVTGTGFIGGNVTIQMGAVIGEAGTFMRSNIRSEPSVLTYEVGAKNIDTTYNGVIEDTTTTDRFTAIRKVGTGKWTLGGVNSYTGITEVNNGTLALSSTGTLALDLLGTLLGTSSVRVNTGGNFDVTAHATYNLPGVQTIAGSGGTIHGNVNVGTGVISPSGVSSAGTLNFNGTLTLGGGLFNLDFATPNVVGSGTNDLIKVTGDLNLASGFVQVAPLGTVTVGADYPLMQYSGALQGAVSNVTLAASFRGNAALQHDVANKLVQLHVNSVSPAASLVWNGPGTNWDVNIGQNWLNGGTADKFFQSDVVTFDDTGGVPTTVTLAGNLLPTSVTVNASVNNYTFSGGGVIAGNASLTKSGTSTLTLSQTASNTYTGGTTINGGAVVLTTTQASLGTGSVVLNNGSTFQFLGGGNNALNVNGTANLVWGNNTNITYGGTLSGSGQLNVFVLGGGSLVNYNGPMADFSGTLNLGGITGGQLRLNNGGNNNAVGGPNIILDMGTSAVSFTNRNGTTITFGALISGSGPTLGGAQTGTGVTTFSIGGLNLSTTYGGLIVNGGGGGLSHLTKVGTGSLTLTNNNTYTGTTNVNAGVLQLDNGGQLSGSGTVNVNGGTLLLTNGGNITAASSLLNVGAAGTFDVSAVAPYSPSSGLTIGGNGIVKGTVNLNQGTIAPGASPGTLTLANDLQINGGSLSFELAPTTTTGGGINDLLVVNGNVNVNSGTVVATFPSLSGPAGSTYRLINFATKDGNPVSSLGTQLLGRGAFHLTEVAGGIDLVVDTATTAGSVRWNATANGIWDNGVNQNWFNTGSASQDFFFHGDNVLFDDTAGVQTTVAIPFNVFPSSVVVNSTTNNYTINGPGVVSGNTSLSKQGGSTLTFGAAQNYTGGTTISGGRLIAPRLSNGTLTINAGTVQITAKGTANTPAGTTVVPALTIATGAQLNLTNNSMVIDYTGPVGSLVSDVRLHVLNNRLITSSGTALLTGLGYGDNAIPGMGLTTFAGQIVDADSILIKFTFFGDTDLDGDVDIADLGNLATNWQTSSPWTGGDFDYNGSVDINDLGLLASNWQAGSVTPLGPDFATAAASLGLPSTAVPEPASMGIITALAGLALKRQRRSR